MPRRASRSASGPSGWSQRLPAPVLAEEHARRLTEPHQRDQQSGVGLALAGAVERDHVGGGVLQQPAYAGPVAAAGTG